MISQNAKVFKTSDKETLSYAKLENSTESNPITNTQQQFSAPRTGYVDDQDMWGIASLNRTKTFKVDYGCTHLKNWLNWGEFVVKNVKRVCSRQRRSICRQIRAKLLLASTILKIVISLRLINAHGDRVFMLKISRMMNDKCV